MVASGTRDLFKLKMVLRSGTVKLVWGREGGLVARGTGVCLN